MERREIKEALEKNYNEIDNLWRRLWRSKNKRRNRKITKRNWKRRFLEWQRNIWKSNKKTK
jgi:hypothetical protein